MLLHLSPANGIVPCVHEVFSIVQAKYSAGKRIVYFNNTTSGPLRHALAESSQPWTKDENVMKQFEYERVSSVLDLAEKLRLPADLVIVEHLDRIAHEPGSYTYAEQNWALAEVMKLVPDAVFIDDWPYLTRYYGFDENASGSKN